MNKQIVVLLLVLATIVSISSASATEINLCEKAVNTPNSWGVCDPSDISKAKGTFTYNEAGTQMDFTASASGLSSDVEYTLIYYKDTDLNHVLPSTVAINVLATATASSGSVSFAGTWIGGNIPSVDDINPRGKIWIIPSSEIVNPNTLLWTGYGLGNIMENYLFESDSIVQDPDDGLAVRDRMGGITYTETEIGTIPSTVTAECAVYTVVLSPLLPSTVSGMDGMLFEADVTPTSLETLTFAWTVDGAPVDPSLVVSDAFASDFTATSYNVNNGVVSIDTIVQIGISSTCGQQIAPVSTIWTIVPQIKSIDVDVDSIDFDSVAPGGTSVRDAEVTNTGNVPVNVLTTASVMTDNGHTIPAPIVNPAVISGLPVSSSENVVFTLTLPVDAYGGEYTGTVEFATS